MGSTRTKHSVDAKPTGQAMKEARRVVQNWEREFASNEFLIAHVAEALDAAHKAGAAGKPLGGD